VKYRSPGCEKNRVTERIHEVGARTDQDVVTDGDRMLATGADEGIFPHDTMSADADGSAFRRQHCAAHLPGAYLMPVAAAMPASAVITAAKVIWAMSEFVAAAIKPMPITGSELPAKQTTR